MTSKKYFALAAAALLTVGLSACNNAASNSAQGSEAGERPVVFASTDVWASVARAVGGDEVEITTAIADENVDPHDYKPSVRDKKLIADADLVVVNGGGYDAWAESMAKETGVPMINAVLLAAEKEIIDATPEEIAEHAAEHAHGHEEGDEHADEHAEGEAMSADEHADEHAEGEAMSADEHADEHAAESGHEGHAHAEFNEHVFYSLDSVGAVAEELSAQLSEKYADLAPHLKENLAKFQSGLKELQTQAARGSEAPEIDVLSTEPVAGYLLQDMGLHDLTPADFIIQSETEAGPSVKVQTQMLGLLEGDDDHDIKLLIVNSQTVDPVSEKLQAAAQKAGIATVSLSETLTNGQEFLEWMGGQIAQVRKALGES